MKGVVVFPNEKSPFAIIQREDGCLCAVKVIGGGRLEFMDPVEIAALEPGSAGRIHDLASDSFLEAVVQKVSHDPTWDETIAMMGIHRP